MFLRTLLPNTEPPKVSQAEPVSQNYNYTQVAKFLAAGNLNSEQLLELREIIDHRLGQLTNLFVSTANIEQTDKANKTNSKPLQTETNSNLSKTTDIGQARQVQPASSDNFESKWVSIISAANLSIPQFERICVIDNSFNNIYQLIKKVIPEYLASSDIKHLKNLTILRIIGILNIVTKIPKGCNEKELAAILDENVKSLIENYATMDKVLALDFIRSFISKVEKPLNLPDSTKATLKNYLLALST